MNEESIVWPVGWRVIRRLKEGMANCRTESWLLTYTCDSEVRKMTAIRKEAEKKLESLRRVLEKFDAKSDLQGSSDEDDSSESDSSSGGITKRKHSFEAEAANIETKIAIEELENALQEIDDKISNMKDYKLRFIRRKREFPENILRVDIPMLKKEEEKENSLNPSNKLIDSAKEKKKKTSSKEEDKSQVLASDFFCGKIYDTEQRIKKNNEKTAIIPQQSCEYPQNATDSILFEATLLMKNQWKYIKKQKIKSFEDSGILPIIYVDKVVKKHYTFGKKESLVTIMPYLQNENVERLMKKIAVKGKQKFSLDMLLASLTDHINCFFELERLKVFHGNLKPSNVFVSDDGFKLLIGDFCLESEAYRRYCDMKHGILEPSACVSPEIRKLISTKSNDFPGFNTLKNEINFFKSDVFSLGLIYYYLMTGELLNPSEHTLEKLHNRIISLNERYGNAEICLLVEKMLEYEPASRASWGGLLGLHSQVEKLGNEAIVELCKLFRGAKNGEKREIRQIKSAAIVQQEESEDEDQNQASQCSIF